MRVNPVDGYNLWAPDYDSAPNPLLALEKRTVTRLLSGKVPRRVVDIACGTGRWMLHFSRAGATVQGIDASPKMLAEAAKHKALHGRVVLGDAQDIPLASNIADLVVCSFAAAYIRDLARLMAELARITVQGGQVAMSDMHCHAAAAGWRRSFKKGAALYEVEHFDHSLPDMREAAEAQGLRPDREFHARFGEDERPIFECAGKQHLYSQLRTIPAVWVGLWTKP